MYLEISDFYLIYSVSVAVPMEFTVYEAKTCKDTFRMKGSINKLAKSVRFRRSGAANQIRQIQIQKGFGVRKWSKVPRLLPRA